MPKVIKESGKEIGTFLFRIIPVVLFVWFGYLTFVSVPGNINRDWLMPLLASYALATLSVIEEKLSAVFEITRLDFAITHQAYIKEAGKKLGGSSNQNEQA